MADQQYGETLRCIHIDHSQSDEIHSADNTPTHLPAATNWIVQSKCLSPKADLLRCRIFILLRRFQHLRGPYECHVETAQRFNLMFSACVIEISTIQEVSHQGVRVSTDARYQDLSGRMVRYKPYNLARQNKLLRFELGEYL